VNSVKVNGKSNISVINDTIMFIITTRGKQPESLNFAYPPKENMHITKYTFRKSNFFFGTIQNC
jgi:hypothetical protein